MSVKARHNHSESKLSGAEVSDIISMAWADDISFDDIRRKYSIAEKEVIGLMRKNLKHSSYRLWRKRVTGRKSKHDAKLRSQGRFNNSLQALITEVYAEHDA